jgi:hypothetical protein
VVYLQVLLPVLVYIFLLIIKSHLAFKETLHNISRGSKPNFWQKITCILNQLIMAVCGNFKQDVTAVWIQSGNSDSKQWDRNRELPDMETF